MLKLKIGGVLAAALVVAGVASASGEPPIKAQALAAARIAQPLSITSKPGNVVFVQVKVMPGGDFGWHYHRSPVVAAVTAGTLTLYDSSDPTCAPRRITAGNAFTEKANHVHLARNDGKKPALVMVAYLGAPNGQKPDVPARAPSQCSVK
ncbi:MAG TPA: cupin domain-containing protein [Gaiellaceae bacterium]|jgi:quercetin dioxygenase-like cupin family protein